MKAVTSVSHAAESLRGRLAMSHISMKSVEDDVGVAGLNGGVALRDEAAVANSSPTEVGGGSGDRASCMATAVALLLSEAHEGQNQSACKFATQSAQTKRQATSELR